MVRLTCFLYVLMTWDSERERKKIGRSVTVFGLFLLVIGVLPAVKGMRGQDNIMTSLGSPAVGRRRMLFFLSLFLLTDYKTAIR